VHGAGAEPRAAPFAALAARGRFTGTAALEEARRTAAGHLRGLGFQVSERRFTYSLAPARLGMPAVGLASAGLLALVAWSWPRADGVASGALAVAGPAALVALARWLTSAAAQALPFVRATGTNLEATRTPAPRVWLVAHLDSKSQRYPLALRALGATLTLAAWLAVFVLVGLRAARLPGAPVAWAVGVGLLGGALLALAASGDASPGAADNASGVAAVLAAAARLDPALPVGVLITDAEEVGLAGAHAWARGRAPGTAINCDTVDDRGRFMLLSAGRVPSELRGAARRASVRCGIPVRVRRLPAGVLTDGVALARAGWRCATLSRATIRTLLRIHTPRDSVGFCTGAGVEPAAALLDAMVRELA
jgi:Peptidase family M28